MSGSFQTHNTFPHLSHKRRDRRKEKKRSKEIKENKTVHRQSDTSRERERERWRTRRRNSRQRRKGERRRTRKRQRYRVHRERKRGLGGQQIGTEEGGIGRDYETGKEHERQEKGQEIYGDEERKTRESVDESKENNKEGDYTVLSIRTVY